MKDQSARNQILELQVELDNHKHIIRALEYKNEEHERKINYLRDEKIQLLGDLIDSLMEYLNVEVIEQTNPLKYKMKFKIQD